MNKRKPGVQHSMHGAFVFVLLGLFALMSTLMVLLGAQMYRNTVSRSAEDNQDRVLAAYVRSMLRAGDARGAVAAEVYDAFPAEGDAEDGDDGLMDFGNDAMGFGAAGAFPVPGQADEAAAEEAPAAEAAPALRWVLREPDAPAPEDAVGRVNTVAITEEIDGREYVTWIYQYDGLLRELFTDRDNAFRPDNGVKVCPANALAASVADGMMTVNLADAENAIFTVRVALRCA